MRLGSTLHCVLWYIALCFVVHCMRLGSTLHCVLWYIELFFVVHCIVFCGKLHCVSWYIALGLVVHCIVLCGTLHDAIICSLRHNCYILKPIHKTHPYFFHVWFGLSYMCAS